MLFISSFSLIDAHHGNILGLISEGGVEGSWINKIGRLHLLFLHFPIALIVMTVLAELLWLLYEKHLFDHAARFMLLAAALFAPVTALLGWALSYHVPYEGMSLDLFEWHRYFGILTTGLVIIAAVLRELYIRERMKSLRVYHVCLFFLFTCVNLTGTFGGVLAFGF
jgi:uncharacterized membrane protein